jgi:uncharacterized protein with HEPN domain
MPKRDWSLFLKDIHTFSRKIISYTKELTIQDLLKDHKTYDAVMRNLQIIGEAIKHLPAEVRAEKRSNLSTVHFPFGAHKL